jgi:hypothetical protein
MISRRATRTFVGILASVLVAGLIAAGAAVAAPSLPKPWWALGFENTPTYLPPGGQGKVIVAATDVGDAGVNATHVPITISDTLPAGLEATGVVWNVGFGSPVYHEQWPTALLPPCTIAGQTVSCTMEPFEPFLPVAALEPSERIEVEISVVVKSGAASGEMNEATISGGEPLRCHEVAPETGGFVDRDCHGEYPFSSPFIPSNPELGSRNFEQEATGLSVAAGHAAQPIVVSGSPIPFGVDEYAFQPEVEGGGPELQAGGHPDQLTTSIVFNQRLERQRGEEEGPANADTLPAPPKNLSFELPPGLIGDPTAVPRCSAAQFFSKPSAGSLINECPPSSAVGIAMITFDEPQNVKLVTLPVPVFNLEPTYGEPARFGLFVGGVLPVVLDASLRTGGDYGVTVKAQRVPEISALLASRITFWGEPGAPGHDGQRGWSCVAGGFYSRLGERLPGCAASQGSGGESAPFLRMPTTCASPLRTPMLMQSWAAGSGFLSPIVPPIAVTPEACNRLPFDPTIEVTPDVHTAASPTGLTVNLTVPQEVSEAPGGLAEADLKDVRVSLPEGVAVNPSSANGLEACAPEQVELHGPEPARCPNGSKIGSVRIDTPLLESPLEGAVYVAKPFDNPFGSLLAIYIAVDDPQDGVVVKLAGHIVPDPDTGRLTTVFSENPQLPFEDFRLHFFGGPQAALTTPQTCGTYSVATEMTPWSAPAGAAAFPPDSFAIASGPEGTACADSPGEEPNQPGFSAGTVTPLAGAYSPFVLHLSRGDGSQQFSRVDAVLPPGLLGKLAGIPYCPDAALTAAESMTGTAEKAGPSCPSSSQVGTVTVGAGAGSNPYYVGGKAYLSGPYKGAPLSLAIITPAVAGPYDLGNVVVRTALFVNQETTQITAKSDPLPTILQGIPLDVRSISLQMDRTNFTLNPTNCERMSVGGTETSVTGQSAALTSSFQVGGCGGLAFAPKLALKVFGPTNRNAKPRFRAVLQMKPGEANIRRAQVNLPHSEFLEQRHIKDICTRAQFNAGEGHGDQCPGSAIYGRAKAWSPLLDKLLEGPVFLRSSAHKLPDLVAALNGQIDVTLDGKVDSGPNGGIRNTFELVPDAPVSKFILEMKGGKKGLLVNSENLCSKHAKTQAIASFTGQNGKIEKLKPKVVNECGRQGGK